ncbi:MAG: Mrp/NBP35 family ATP-binding protein [Thermoplasmata archaeon]|nr:Mrp/NBP35 family ATP-binding protein [Thermoplasmata archaeon]
MGAPNKEVAELSARIMYNVSKIKNKLIVMSGKGGVGKTTVAINLASGMAKAGYKVGLMDVDIHGPNVPKMLGIEDSIIEPEEDKIKPIKVTDNLSVMSMAFLLPDKDAPVIWRGPMKMQLIDQFLGDFEWGDLDYLVVDLPPGTGDESLSIAQRIPQAEAIIVSTPQEVALLDSRKAVNFARNMKMPVLGIIENMSGFKCPHCAETIDLFKTGGGEKTAKEMDIGFLGRVPIDPQMVLLGDSGSPVVLTEGESAEAFAEIIKNIEDSRK